MRKANSRIVFALLTTGVLATLPMTAMAADCVQLGGAGLDMIAEAGPPATLPAAIDVQRDIAYGADPAQRIDVYGKPGLRNAPVILMVHGGGWRRGDKGHRGVVQNKAAFWVPKGYLFISINYRLSPQADPVVEASDVAKALAFAQGHAASWGGDSARFVLMGHSAGAHLIALLNADPAIAAQAGAKPWLGTVVLDSGALDVGTIMQGRHFCLYDDAFGGDHAFWDAASPTVQLKAAPQPMILVCSTRRADSCSQADAFAEKATALGGKVSVLREDLRHGEINAQLGTAGDYTDNVEAFLRSLGLP